MVSMIVMMMMMLMAKAKSLKLTLVSIALNQKEIFLLPGLNGMLVHYRVTPAVFCG